MEIYRGLVLAERSAGERGKFIDVLTEHNTVREIYVRGAKKNTSAGLSATQLFSYANFSIRKQQKGLYLDSAEPIRIFYRLRESLSRLSLAMYFSELVRLSVREHQTPAQAEALYESCKAYCRERVPVVESGIFGADMQVELCNDGPFTVMLDSDEIIKR